MARGIQAEERSERASGLWGVWLKISCLNPRRPFADLLHACIARFEQGKYWIRTDVFRSSACPTLGCFSALIIFCWTVFTVCFSFLRETEANKTKHARQMAEKKREAESSVNGVFYCCVIVQWNLVLSKFGCLFRKQGWCSAEGAPCGVGSIPQPDFTNGFSLLLVPVLALKVFLWVLQISSFHKNQHCWFQLNLTPQSEELFHWNATAKIYFIFLFNFTTFCVATTLCASSEGVKNVWKNQRLLNQFKSSIILRRAPGARDPEINPVEPRKVKIRIFMRKIWLLTNTSHC